MKKTIFYILTATISSFSFGADQNFSFPEPNLKEMKKLELWATYYHIWSANEVENGYNLLDKRNKSISQLITAKDLCMGGIEGTIQIKSKDGELQTYNYADHKGKQLVDCSSILKIDKPWIGSIGKTRYKLANGKYGDGVRNYKLIPYRTIAVDHKKIPYGTVLYIPNARGIDIKLPSGIMIKHDGYFYAADTGGAIKDNHIDLFSGVYLKNPFSKFIKSKKENTFSAYIIEDENIISSLELEHIK